MNLRPVATFEEAVLTCDSLGLTLPSLDQWLITKNNLRHSLHKVMIGNGLLTLLRKPSHIYRRYRSGYHLGSSHFGRVGFSDVSASTDFAQSLDI